jgi:hypothetical protein
MLRHAITQEIFLVLISVDEYQGYFLGVKAAGA